MIELFSISHLLSQPDAARWEVGGHLILNSYSCLPLSGMVGQEIQLS